MQCHLWCHLVRLLKLLTSNLEIVLSHSLLRFVVQCNCFLVLHSRRSDLGGQRYHSDRMSVCVLHWDAPTQCGASKGNRSKRIVDKRLQYHTCCAPPFASSMTSATAMLWEASLCPRGARVLSKTRCNQDTIERDSLTHLSASCSETRLQE